MTNEEAHRQVGGQLGGVGGCRRSCRLLRLRLPRQHAPDVGAVVLVALAAHARLLRRVLRSLLHKTSSTEHLLAEVSRTMRMLLPAMQTTSCMEPVPMQGLKKSCFNS